MYVTYSDLIQFGILIVAVIALCKSGDKSKRPPNEQLDGQTNILGLTALRKAVILFDFIIHSV